MKVPQDISPCHLHLDLQARVVYLTFHFVTLTLGYREVLTLVNQLHTCLAMLEPSCALPVKSTTLLIDKAK